MKYPNFLNKNKTIFLVTPSFGCGTEPYKSRLIKSISNLENLGFKIKQSKHNFDMPNFLEAHKIDRSKEFMEAYTNKECNLLLSVGGGMFLTEILPFIDFNTLNNSIPKWFMGYSDNTDLTFLLTTLCDVATIYGPCAPEFGSVTLDKSHYDFFDLITGNKLSFKGYPKYEFKSIKDEFNPLLPYNLDTNKILTLYPNNNLNFEGRLIGGCLDNLLNIVGTNYDKVKEFTIKYSTDKIVWFLEACDLNVIQVRRGLIQLKRAGWFNNVSGFIIGRPLNPDSIFNITSHNSVIDVLKDLSVPIILDADIGHLKPMMPIICGAYAKVKAFKNDLEIDYILK